MILSMETDITIDKYTNLKVSLLVITRHLH